MVERRDVATLHPIIARCVWIGTDPVSGIHTQEVESCWNNLKLGQKIRRGIGREDMKSYLDEKMWRQWRAENPQNAMDNFLAVLAGQYIVNNPVL